MQGVVVHIDGRPLNPRFDLYSHSPDGFEWGYSGSGPSQLALAICAHALQDDLKAIRVYQRFRDATVANWKGDTWKICKKDVLAIIADLQSPKRTLNLTSWPLLS